VVVVAEMMIMATQVSSTPDFDLIRFDYGKLLIP
jgi:hypothetical protein